MRTLRGYFILAAAAIVGCGTAPANAPPPISPVAVLDAAPDPPEKPGAAKVVIDNFTFDPPTLTVPVGTEVTWVNQDDVPHTATSVVKPRAIDSGTLDTDQTYSHVFTTAGEYDYFCAVHPHMTGKVVVK